MCVIIYFIDIFNFRIFLRLYLFYFLNNIKNYYMINLRKRSFELKKINFNIFRFLLFKRIIYKKSKSKDCNIIFYEMKFKKFYKYIRISCKSFSKLSWSGKNILKLSYSPMLRDSTTSSTLKENTKIYTHIHTHTHTHTHTQICTYISSDKKNWF